MFEFLKKKKQEDKEQMTTLEQIRKAYDDLSDEDKKSFHEYQQSLSDRVHESIAAQEREDGNEDSQSAEAREHEALGAEHADGEGDVDELHEQGDTAEEKREDAKDEAREEAQEERHEETGDAMQAILDRLAKIEERLATEKASDEAALENAEKVYGLGNGVFASEREEQKAISPKEAAEITRKIKG